MLRISKNGVVSESDRTLNGSYTERLISNVEDFSGMGFINESDLFKKELLNKNKEQAKILYLNEKKRLHEEKLKAKELLKKKHNQRILNNQKLAKHIELNKNNIAALVALTTKKELKNSKTMGNANWGQYEIIDGSLVEPDINDPHRDYSKIEQSYFIGQPIGKSIVDSEIVGYFPEGYGVDKPQMGDFWSDLRDKVVGKSEDVLQTKLPEIVEKGLTSIIDPQSGQKYNVDPNTGRVLGPASSLPRPQSLMTPEIQKMMMYGIVGFGGLAVLMIVLKMFKKQQPIIIQGGTTA